MDIPGIAHVSARVREIQSRVQSPNVPGAFQSLLNQQLASRTAASDATETTGSPSMAVASWDTSAVTTLGVMLGMPVQTTPPEGPARVSLPPFPGIATSSELEAYLLEHGIEARNGVLQPGELTAVSGGWNDNARLLPPAASAWEEMRAAAAADGVDLLVIDSYRTYESQARAYEAHLRGEKTANVLPPGTSEHGNGLAVDVTNGSIIGTDDPEWHWLQQNAARFGWYPISNETWHWEFRGVTGSR